MSNPNPNPNILTLHRWADREGKKLCAMTALSKKLGYTILTDIPKEVDPGLAVLVNLLNDRANDKARQLLASRLDHIPNTGRTDICSLIADVFFPQALEDNGFEAEAQIIADCKGRRETTRAYASLGERFLEPDGSGLLASGCITLVSALKSKDPLTQDILAVSAASLVASFETGDGWFELLYILDYILGLEDAPRVGSLKSMGDFCKYFGEDEPTSGAIEEPDQVDEPELVTEDEKRPIEEVYDCGIKGQWFPALVAKFPDRLEDIAERILKEVWELASTTIFIHRFKYEDEQVMISTSWDDDHDILSVDADLVAYLDPIGEVDVDGDEKKEIVLIPVPASDAGTIH